MELDISKLLSRFKVHTSPVLFDTTQNEFYAILKANRCIYCSNKLKFMRNGKMAYCRSVKHKKTFIISVEKLKHLNGQ